MVSRFAIVAALLALVACGGSEASEDPATAGGVGGTKQSFGSVPDLQLWGYIRHDATGLANEAPLGAVSFDAIQNSTDKTHALLHVSGFT
jgi:hypothetical protein